MADDVREQPRDDAPRAAAPEESGGAPAPRAVAVPRVQLERPRCPFCHEGVNPDVAKAACDACMAWHHKLCWDEGGGCGACGARASAVAAASRPASRPAAPRLAFEDAADLAVHAHRSNTARAKRRQRRPFWKTLAFSAVLSVVVLALFFGASALLAWNPLVAGVLFVGAGVTWFFRSYRSFQRRRGARASGPRPRRAR